MYGALAEPMIWYVEWFSMTIHTTCCQAGGVAVTPHGWAEPGCGPGAGGGDGAGGGTGPGRSTGCAPGEPEGAAPGGAPGSLTDGATLVVPAGLRSMSRGACAPASRLVRTTRSRPLVASASPSTPLSSTRRVTSTSFQWRARSAPVRTSAWWSVAGSRL